MVRFSFFFLLNNVLWKNKMVSNRILNKNNTFRFYNKGQNFFFSGEGSKKKDNDTFSGLYKKTYFQKRPFIDNETNSNSFDIWFKHNLRSVNIDCDTHRQVFRLDKNSLYIDANSGSINNRNLDFVENRFVDHLESVLYEQINVVSNNDTKHFYYYDDTIFLDKNKLYPSFESYERDFDYLNYISDYNQHSIWKRTSIWNNLNSVEPDRFFSSFNKINTFFKNPDVYDFSATTGTEFFIIFFEFIRRRIVSVFSFFESNFFLVFSFFFFFFFFVLLFCFLLSYKNMTNNIHSFAKQFTFSYKNWWYFCYIFFFDLLLSIFWLCSVLFFSDNIFIIEIKNTSLIFSILFLFYFNIFFFFILSYFIKHFYFLIIKPFFFHFVEGWLKDYAGLEGEIFFFDNKRSDYDYIWLSVLSFILHMFFFFTFVVFFFYAYIFSLNNIVIGSGSGFFHGFSIFNLYRLSLYLVNECVAFFVGDHEKKLAKKIYKFFLLYNERKNKEFFRNMNAHQYRSSYRLSIKNSKLHYNSRYWLRNFFSSKFVDSSIIYPISNNTKGFNTFNGVVRLNSNIFFDGENSNNNMFHSFLFNNGRLMNRRKFVSNYFLSSFSKLDVGFTGRIIDYFFYFITTPYSFYRSSLVFFGNNRAVRNNLNLFTTSPLQFLLLTNYIRHSSILNYYFGSYVSTNLNSFYTCFSDILADYSYRNRDLNYILIKKFLLSHQVLSLFTSSYYNLIRNNTLLYINDDLLFNSIFYNSLPSEQIKSQNYTSFLHSMLMRLFNNTLYRRSVYRSSKITLLKSFEPVYRVYTDNNSLDRYQILSMEYDRLYKHYFFSLFHLFFDAYDDLILPVVDNNANRFIKDEQVFDYVDNIFKGDDILRKHRLLLLLNRRKFWYVKK